MCGIAGLVSYNSSNTQRWTAELEKMVQTIAHRGNDGQGFYTSSEKNCFFGHRRLSIIDQSAMASQPMTSRSGRYVITFNGEIYNYQEVAQQLVREGLQFKTKSDTEVLLEGFALHGFSILSKLRGMYAFAIWDNGDQRLYSARDHMGIKPLYWTQVMVDGDSIFAFASELKALLATSFISRRINKQALCQYLTYYSVNAPHTMLDGVHSLLPGHYLIYDRQGVQIQKYWDPTTIKTDNELTDITQIRKQTAGLLTESVAQHMRSDIPVGAFLSGGLDSATIVGLMARCTDKPVQTFSIGFGEEGKALNELSLARKVAQKYGTKHYELIVDGMLFKEELDHFIEAIDQPSGDGLNSYLVAKATAMQVSVALSGLGGDELFLGYSYVQDLVQEQYMRHSFQKSLLPTYAWLYQKNNLFRSYAFYNRLHFLRWWPAQGEDQYHAMRTLFNASEIDQLLIEKIQKSDVSLHHIFSSESDLLHSFSKAELAWYTPGMLLRDADPTSMAFTLEVRFPFLDRLLIEYLLRVPSRYKVVRGQRVNKPLLVSLFDDLIPPELIKAKKRGFEMPVGHWLATYGMHEVERLREVTWLNKEHVGKLLYEFSRKPHAYLKVWTLLVLKKWIERYDIEMEEIAGLHEKKDFIHPSRQGNRRSTTQSSLFDSGS